MNAQDCENIGLALADNEASEFVRKQFYALDPRIEREYEGFRKVIQRDKDVMADFVRRLESRFGKDWCLKKACTPEIRAELLDEARKEIYGEDYCPSFFR